ncbi:MAG: Piwi domain-containing protein [Promethearchaeota archaeon]
MIEFGSINSIEYEFHKGKKSTRPFDGLKECGPVDLNERKFDNIDLVMLSPENTKENLDLFCRYVGESLKDFFRIYEFTYKIITYNEHNFHKRIVEKNLSEPPQNKKTQRIILHYHNFFLDRYDAPYYQIKRELLSKGISTQGLLRANFRQKKFYSNNVACGIYAKLGGRPWAISGTISKIFVEDTIYMGFDISRKKYGKATYKGPGCVVVYDEKGQHVYHFTEYFPINHDMMEHDVAKNLMEMTIARFYEEKKRIPKNIVFMRDGDIPEVEVQGFLDAITNKDIGLHIIEVRKRGNIPIIMKKFNSFDLADSGTFMQIRTGNRHKPYDLFIQNLGNDIKLPSMPRALKITPLIIDQLDQDVETYVEDIVRQVFILTNLNWASLVGRTSLPITVHYAHEAANLMRAGINPKNIDTIALWML